MPLAKAQILQRRRDGGFVPEIAAILPRNDRWLRRAKNNSRVLHKRVLRELGYVVTLTSRNLLPGAAHTYRKGACLYNNLL